MKCPECKEEAFSLVKTSTKSQHKQWGLYKCSSCEYKEVIK